MDLDTIVCGDALEVMAAMPPDSVDLIAVDPPYYRVKGNWWDRQWDTPTGFLDWIGQLCEAWHRILRPNGSLYVFAEPKMVARVECKIAEWFNVINQIVWDKGDGSGAEKGARAGLTRSYIRQTERIVFAEHYGRDGSTILGQYIKQAREAAGLKGTNIDIVLGYVRTKDPTRGTELCRRWEEGSSIPKVNDFIKAMQYCGINGNTDLRREYEDLRRPFNATPDAPYTDVWTFKTVAPYPGKHPCEKPLDLMEHIVKMSSKPGGVVFDCCCGNGTTLLAARKQGRHWYGCDVEEKYIQRARERLGQVQMELEL